MQSKTTGSVDLVAAVGFAVLGVLLTVGSTRLPGFGESHQSPGITPFVVGVLMTGCSLLLGVGAIGRLRSRYAKAVRPERSGGSVLRILGALALMGLYLGAIMGRQIPFVYATFGFLALSMLYFGARDIVRVLALAACTSLGTLLIFGRIFRVPLP